MNNCFIGFLYIITSNSFPAKAHGSTRDKVICFDLQGPFDKSKHAGNRYCLNFYEYDDEGKRIEGSEAKKRQWHLGFLQTKDQFPDRLEEFLNSVFVL